MNTINYRDLKQSYIDNEEAKALAKKIFGNRQPAMHETGYYSAPSWNWAYRIGVVGVEFIPNGGEEELREINYYEVVTQFGVVVAARHINIPTIAEL